VISHVRTVALTALLATLAGCFSDVLSSSHSTRADAADTIARGWIPAVLPESSVDIRESHNLDTNVGHGTFAFGDADVASFKAKLTPVQADRSVRATSRETLEKSGYVFYSYEDFDIAVNWNDREGQFWLGPAQ
jgi:hypothetical protein